MYKIIITTSLFLSITSFSFNLSATRDVYYGRYTQLDGGQRINPDRLKEARCYGALLAKKLDEENLKLYNFKFNNSIDYIFLRQREMPLVPLNLQHIIRTVTLSVHRSNNPTKDIITFNVEYVTMSSNFAEIVTKRVDLDECLFLT